MASFVFIHGSWTDSWCWHRVVAGLVARGHEALAIDLPGHGEDRSPPEAVRFQDYVNRTVEAVNLSKDRPILVGHSMGGAIISQAAESAANRIHCLVCLAALVPPNGASMLDDVSGFDPEYLAQIIWAPDRRTAQINPEGARRFLYSNCQPADVESALPHLSVEPVTPYEAPLSLTEANFGQVPRYYIQCLRDRVVPIALQRSVCTAIPFERVYSLDTDHSPFLSLPEELTSVLRSIAQAAPTAD